MSQPFKPDPGRPRGWRELCEAAATEPDPNKLIALIGEINKAFDEMDQQRNTARENLKLGIEFETPVKFSGEA